MKRRQHRLESLESRYLLAGESLSFLENASYLASGAAGQDAPMDAMREAILRLAQQEYGSQFGTYASSPQCFCITWDPFPSFLIDPHSANVQFSTVASNQNEVDDQSLVTNDDQHLYQLIGGDLVITRTNPDGSLQFLSRTSFTGRPTNLHLSNDRLTVIAEDSESESVGVLTVFDVSRRDHPHVVQTLHFEGDLLHSQLIDNQLVVAARPPRTLLPTLEKHSVSGSLYWETEQQFRDRISDNFAELLGERLPYYSARKGGHDFSRSGPLVTPEQIAGLSTFNELTVFFSVDLGGDEPGISSSKGILLNRELAHRTYQYSGEIEAFIPDHNHFVETSDGFYWINGTNGYSGEFPRETTLHRFRVNTDDGSLEVIADTSVQSRLADHVVFSATDHSLVAAEHWIEYQNDVPYGTRIHVSRFEQQGETFLVEEEELSLDASMTSIHLHDDSLFAVEYTDADWFPIEPSQTVIHTAELFDDLENDWSAQPIQLPGFQTYLNFIEPDRLLAIGAEMNTQAAFPNPTFLSLYELNDGSPRLLDQVELAGQSAGTVSGSADSFLVFDDQETFAFPVRIEDQSGWNNGVWAGGEALSIVTIDSGQELFDSFTSSGQHLHNQVVRRTIEIGDCYYSVSDAGIMSGKADAEGVVDSVFFSGDHEIHSVDSELEQLRIIETEARNLLSQNHSLGPETLVALGFDHGSSFDQAVFDDGTAKYLVRIDDDGLTLIDQQFRYQTNIYHNLQLPTDANLDGETTPSDALVVINALAISAGGEDSRTQPLRSLMPANESRLDTNNDQVISPIDALLVINYLARMQSEAAGEELIRSVRLQVIDDALRDDQWIGSLF
ncbi:Beta propeller domain protein [Stieleria maiorica]|uniref:Beta propeller domain protein n=1 Tax=Stieleria maiorica TaxID=2795974 RepID=A0A5B9MAH5_9BACT|nr:beta-propeller domain-containing protein [Stieleria maiorica]QEF98291.1 Beta propeller domain protein [Stieleria maiorica]